MSLEGTRKKERLLSVQPSELQPLRMLSPEEAQDVRNTACWPQRAEMYIKGMISVSPDSCHTQKSTRFLNLGYLVFFNLQKTCYVQTTCPLLQSFYITWLLPTTPPSSPFWTCYRLSSSPRNFHWIKRNSQLLGHMYFFQLTSSTRDLTWTPCIGSWSLNHWTTRGAPPFDFLYLSGLDMGTKSTWLYLKNPIYIAF